MSAEAEAAEAGTLAQSGGGATIDCVVTQSAEASENSTALRGVGGYGGPPTKKVEYVGRRVKPRDYTRVDTPTPAEVTALRASQDRPAEPGAAIRAVVAEQEAAARKAALAAENEEIARRLVAELLADLEADDRATARGYAPDNPYRTV